MKQARLGDLTVSAIGLGCMGMSQAYGKPDRAESERTLNRALEIGVTFLDTANVYGAGHNETLIGEVLGNRRSEFTLATKFGIVRRADGKGISVDGSPEQIATRCEESLTRLQTDVIDLYYLHRVDPNVPIEDTVGAMAELVKQGKVRHLGLSEVSAKNLRRAHATHPIAAVQSEYSLWTKDPEAHVLPACRELGIGFVPFSPLGRAILTGRLNDAGALEDDDMRRGMPRFQGENFDANLARIEQVKALAEQNGCTPGQLALAWLVSQGDDIAPIPGTKRVSYLEENAAAADIVLGPDAIGALSAIFGDDGVAGERYNQNIMAALDRD